MFLIGLPIAMLFWFAPIFVYHAHTPNPMYEYVSKGLKGKTITCHLGSGSSISAILNGKPIDTSMGFTPLEGLIMGTRSGTIDPGIIFFLKKRFMVK